MATARIGRTGTRGTGSRRSLEHRHRPASKPHSPRPCDRRADAPTRPPLGNRIVYFAAEDDMPGPPGAQRLTWVGHPTLLPEVDAVRLLTDPALRPRAPH